MKKILKRVAIFLILCLLNTIIPLPALAAEADDILSKLTPQQKQKIQSLSPAEKSQIQSQLGLTPPAEKTTQNAPAQAPQQTSPPTAGETSPAAKAETTEINENLSTKTSAPALEGETSAIEQGFVSQVGSGTEKAFRQFGYDVFGRVVGQKFAMTASLPIGPDYRINPGDKLLVTVWGNVNDTFALDVDERGVVTVPKVGVVAVAGHTLAEAKDIIYQRLASVFIVDFNIDLAIKEVGPIKVYLLGEFVKPGAYTLTATNTLYDAIFIGGGATRQGSLRQIELVRGGETIRTVDLYDFVLTGRKNADLSLKTGDVVRVPSIGKVVAISGNVRKPAIYELKTKTELSDFIGLAGGITPTSYLQRVQIQRKKQNRVETAIDVNYADYLKVKNVKPIYLENLDYISLFSIQSTIRNVVYLSGNVIRPGRYELEPGMKLMDLIVKAEGLAPDTYMERAQLYRLVLPDMHPTIIAINLTQMKNGDPRQNPALQEFDQIRIFSRPELAGQPKVYISGEINDGDTSFPLTVNMHVSDLIYQAGGVKESTYLAKAELVRTDADNKMTIYTLNLENILNNKDKNEDILLQKNDSLFVRRIPDFAINPLVTVTGNVKFPGKYPLQPGERLSDLIAQMGGYTDKAFVDGAIFIREPVKIRETQAAAKVKDELELKRQEELAQVVVSFTGEDATRRITLINNKYTAAIKNLTMDIPGRILVDLNRLAPGNSQDLVLQPNDSLYIPDQRVGVMVMGEVFSPGTIVFERNKSIDDYINACGGGTTYSNLGETRILHANGKSEKRGWQVSIRPGDTIFVPIKPVVEMYQKPFDWNEFWDISLKATTVLAQTATAIVTLYLLSKNLNK